MKMYIQRFRVTGSGQFPFSMLRYDSCYPLQETDVQAMTNHHPDYPSSTPRCVMLERIVRAKSTPTADRWESFGWKVDPESIETNPI